MPEKEMKPESKEATLQDVLGLLPDDRERFKPCLITTDDMRPTFQLGDAVVVDTEDTAIADGRIYLISIAGIIESALARLYAEGGTMTVEMLHQALSEKLILENKGFEEVVTIHGRAIAHSRLL